MSPTTETKTVVVDDTQPTPAPVIAQIGGASHSVSKAGKDVEQKEEAPKAEEVIIPTIRSKHSNHFKVEQKEKRRRKNYVRNKMAKKSRKLNRAKVRG